MDLLLVLLLLVAFGFLGLICYDMGRTDELLRIIREEREERERRES